ncbi:MAG: RNA polymerase sigma factor [Gemmatimonadota bacterium]
MHETLQMAPGDEAETLEGLVARYRPVVYAVALRMTGDPFGAEDVTQDVFAELPGLLPQYRPPHFARWLKEITRLRALRHMRLERRQPLPVPIRADALVVESHEERVLCRRTLEGALRRLDPALCAVFLLRELEGYSHDEIAGVMGGSAVLSRVRLFRAREALRGMLTT